MSHESGESYPQNADVLRDARVFIVDKSRDLLDSAIIFDNQMAGNPVFASRYVRHGIRFRLDGSEVLVCHKLRLVPKTGRPLHNIRQVEVYIPESELYRSRDGRPTFVLANITSTEDAEDMLLIGDFGMSVFEEGMPLPLGIDPATLSTVIDGSETHPDLSDSELTTVLAEAVNGYRLGPQLAEVA